jgi:acyl-CoA synthetase (AMP-forming)/AMP-acid ligase II/aryl carrier-like protein
MADLADAILRRNSDRSNEPALICTGQALSTIPYTTLDLWVQRVRATLEAAGLSRGSTCCLALPNGPAFVAAFIAAIDLKAAIAPLNPALKQSEISHTFESLQVDLLIGPRDFHKNDDDLIRAANDQDFALAECCWSENDLVFQIVREQGVRENSLAGLSSGSDFVALILHTSGTTGRPKAVPLLQSNLRASTNSVIESYGLTASDRSILIMPLFHIHGIVAGLLAPLLAGSAVIIPDKGLGPDFWSDFDKHHATWWTATPTHHKVLLLFLKPPDSVQPRFIRSCSSPLAPSLLRELEDTFRAPVLEAYAMTENAHHISSHALDRERTPGTVGSPCSTISLKIIDDSENEVDQGCVGEVVIKGPSVMPGYLDNDDANAKAFTVDGYFRTGDQGKIDETGHVRLTGRLKELINKGGENISPNEVDQIVLEHEDVAEAIAFAVPDELYGEEVAIAVVLKPGKNLEAAVLKQWLRPRITAIKIPQHVYMVDAIPKTATGKAQRSGFSKLATPSGDLSRGQNEAEALQALWSEILGIEGSSISEERNFFDLGGNSVLAIRLASKAKAKGWNLDAATVFRHPTLKAMTQQCAERPQQSNNKVAVSIADMGDLQTKVADACGVGASLVQDIAPGTPVQKALASSNRDLGLWVLSLTFSCQNVGLARLETIVETIRSRNPILRARTVQIGSETYTAVIDDEAIWETSSNLSRYLGQVTGVRIPYGSPQVRYAFIDDVDEGTHFVITTTHATQDLWTRKLLYEELQAGLEDIRKLQKSPNPASFCDFARHAANHDRGEAERYWSKVLDGFTRWSYLDRNDDRNATGGHIIVKTIQPRTTASHDFGDIACIHLAWCLTLSLLSKEDKIFFPSVSSGRLAEVPGVKDMMALMGPTITSIPICIDLSALDTVSDGLARLRGLLYDGVRYELSGSECITQHFKTREREALLNCSDVPGYDGMTITGKDSSLRFRPAKGNMLYGKITIPLNMRVAKRGDGLRLEATIDVSALSLSTVQGVMDCFERCLQAVNAAEPEMSLAMLKHEIQSEIS